LATIASTTADSVLDLISTIFPIDHHIRKQKYDTNSTSRTNWFHLAGIHCTLSEPEPLDAFESIEGLLNTEVDDICLPAYFWEQTDTPFPRNIYWTEAAAYGGGLELHDPVFGNNWTRYWGAHSWCNCEIDTPCWCEGHDCRGTHETEARAPAAAETAEPLETPLFVVKPPTPTPSELDQFNWHWLMCLIRCNVRVTGTPSGAGVPRRSGHHHGTHRSQPRNDAQRSHKPQLRTSPGSDDEDRSVLAAGVNHPGGVPAPGTNNRPTETGYRRTDEAVLTPLLRSHDVRTTDPGVEGRPRRSPENPSDGGDRRGFTGRTGRYDTRRPGSQRGEPEF